MIKKEIFADLSQVIQYLANYPAVKGSECHNWSQVLTGLQTIYKDLEQINKEQEAITQEMIEALEE